ncbi:MAG: polymer-forming cytoskeletal protein [Myxococcota bacterium]
MFVLYLAASVAMAQPVDPPVAPEAPMAETPDVAPPAPPTAPAPPTFETDEIVDLRGAGNDAFGAGKSVYVRESVGDNAFLAGENLHIDAPVMGDLFAAGESIHIDATVHGDVYTAGETIFLGPDGQIDGHLFAYGSMVHIGGPVLGDVSAGAGKVVIAAPVSGDVKLEAGEMVLSPGGTVGGDLRYSTPNEVPAAASVVDGQAVWTQHIEDDEEETSLLGQIFGWTLWTGWSYLAQLLVGAVLLLLLGKSARRAAGILVERPSLSLGVGAVSLVMLPLLSIIAIVLLIPMPLGFLGMALFAVMLYLGQIVAAQALGDVLLRRLRPDAVGRPVMSIAIGLVPIVLLVSIPWVGILIGLVTTVLGTGAIGLWMRERRAA